MDCLKAVASTAILAVGLGALAAGQAAKGDQWEITSQPSMAGVSIQMPPSTTKVCVAKEWRAPPGGRKNCKNSNMEIEGTKVTWDVQCTDPSTTGHGKIVRDGENAYNGSIKFTGDQAMTIKLSGKKLGECDNPQ